MAKFSKNDLEYCCIFGVEKEGAKFDFGCQRDTIFQYRAEDVDGSVQGWDLRGILGIILGFAGTELRN